MSSRETKELMGHYTLLGQKVARKNKDLAQLACIHPEIREIIGLVYAYCIINNIDPKHYERQIEALIKLGRAVWPRKELTDLALMVGSDLIVQDASKDLEEFQKEIEELEDL